MGIGVSVYLIALGLILALAVNVLVRNPAGVREGAIFREARIRRKRRFIRERPAAHPSTPPRRRAVRLPRRSAAVCACCHVQGDERFLRATTTPTSCRPWPSAGS